MTIPRYQRLTDYWKNSPPLHVMVAGYLGVGTKKKTIDDLKGQMGALGLGTVKQVPRSESGYY